MPVLFGGVVYGFYTRSGSGIERHPNDGRDGAPGAGSAPEAAGGDEGDGSSLSMHGAK